MYKSLYTQLKDSKSPRSRIYASYYKSRANSIYKTVNKEINKREQKARKTLIFKERLRTSP